ncbi:MAG TPA: response regulator [Oceanospirillaceae bacterium]|nr:response regulator [Oceanospirillaceae bacterium]
MIDATSPIRALDELKASKPVVAVSARRNLKVKTQWKEQGLDDFLTKPLTEESLLSVLERYR